MLAFARGATDGALQTARRKTVREAPLPPRDSEERQRRTARGVRTIRRARCCKRGSKSAEPDQRAAATKRGGNLWWGRMAGS